MKTSDVKLLSLVAQVNNTYTLENALSLLFVELQSPGNGSSRDAALVEEARENKKFVHQLEAVLVILTKINRNEVSPEVRHDCYEKVSDLFQRLIIKHSICGYHTALSVAKIQGKNRIASTIIDAVGHSLREHTIAE